LSIASLKFSEVFVIYLHLCYSLIQQSSLIFNLFPFQRPWMPHWNNFFFFESAFRERQFYGQYMYYCIPLFASVSWYPRQSEGHDGSRADFRKRKNSLGKFYAGTRPRATAQSIELSISWLVGWPDKANQPSARLTAYTPRLRRFDLRLLERS